MKHFTLISISGWFLVVMAALNGRSAQAALGDHATSVETDRQRLRAALTSRQSTNFTVHELQTSAGLIVREYAAIDGTVFAVGWQGPTKPDLSQLLGTYFTQYRNAPRTAESTRRHARVSLPNLQVIETARMRLFTGVAYDPALFPTGVSVGDILQ